MGRGPGVSVAELPNGRWRVRWRESQLDESTGVTRTVQRERVVDDESTAIALRAKVLRQLELGEVPEVDAVRRIPAVASLDAVWAGWLRAQAARSKGGQPTSGKTLENLGRHGARVLGYFRSARGIPTDRAVPGSVLTRDSLSSLVLALRTELSEIEVSKTVRSLHRAWTWASDDPAEYPGLATPPRDTSGLPSAPTYTAPDAPRMAELDAVIRRIPTRAVAARRFAVIARCTGLRLAQIGALTWADVDLDGASLWVQSGKSSTERGGRTVPIAQVLVAFLRPLGAPEGWVLPRRSARAPEPLATLTAAWKAAEASGQARSEVWRPKNREIARPDHAFRSGFQHHLVSAGVRDEVIDALVGHARTTRDRHYVDASARWSAMVAAVAEIPEIDERDPEAVALPDNVSQFKR